jgi:hypothetical protein
VRRNLETWIGDEWRGGLGGGRETLRTGIGEARRSNLVAAPRRRVQSDGLFLLPRSVVVVLSFFSVSLVFYLRIN